MKEIEKINAAIKKYYANVMNDFALKDFYLINAKKEMPILDGSYKFQPVRFILLNLKDKTNHSEKLKLYIEKTFNDSYYIFGDNKFLPFDEEFKNIEISNDAKKIEQYMHTSCRKDQ